MSFSNLLIAAIVASALPFVYEGSPAFAQQVLRPAKERGNPLAESNPVSGITKERRLSLCLESWDSQTHMSRREWRVACQRSVKDYPQAFR